MTKISVCIPVYKAQQYIQKCANSLFEQSQKNDIEFIFVNDNTPDKSIDILRNVLENYPERKGQVKIINHNVNLGSGAARHTAINVAKGEYVIFCDSDDWVAPQMYAEMLEVAETTKSDIVICEYIMEYKNKSLFIKIPDSNNNIAFTKAMLECKIHCGTCNKLIRKNIWRDNEIDFEQGIDMWEDIGTIIPLCLSTQNISIVHKPLYHYNQENQSSYTHFLNEKSLESMQKTIDKLEKFIGINAPILLQSLNYLKLTVKLNCLINSSGAKQKKYSHLYPETDKFISSYNQLSIFWKIGLMANRYHQLWLFNILKTIKNRITG